jgi:cation transport ATPase
LEMGGHLFRLHALIGQQTSNWVQFALSTPVVLWTGWPFFERGARSLVTRNLNMFTLIAMGHWYRLGIQRYCDFGAESFPAGFPERRRFGRDLL